MAVTYNKMLLDINAKPNDIITAVQNDTNSRYLDVLLYDNGTPIDLTGCEVKIFMKKPENGGDIWDDGVITEAENGRCEFLLTTEALAKFGHLQVQISIWKDNEEILSSQIFEIIVTKSLPGESSVESSNEYGTLVVLFQNLYEAYDLMTRMVQNIGEPDEVAAQYDLATMWQCWEFLVAYMKGDFTDKVDEAIANSSTQGVLNILNTTTAKEDTSQEILGKVDSVAAQVQKKCIASDNTATTLINSAVTSQNDSPGKELAKILIKNLNGTVRVTASLKNADSTYKAFLYVVNELRESGGGNVSVTGSSYQTVTMDIVVTDGDVLSFCLATNFTASSTHQAYCNLLTIGYDSEELTENNCMIVVD